VENVAAELQENIELATGAKLPLQLPRFNLW